MIKTKIEEYSIIILNDSDLKPEFIDKDLFNLNFYHFKNIKEIDECSIVVFNYYPKMYKLLYSRTGLTSYEIIELCNISMRNYKFNKILDNNDKRNFGRF